MNSKRGIIQVNSIAPKDHNELKELLRVHQARYNKAWLMLQFAIEKHKKDKQLK